MSQFSEIISARLIVLFLPVMAVLVSGCSSSGGSGTADEALGKLTSDQQQAYQTWLKAPVKSCQAFEVVGGSASAISSGPGRSESRENAIEKGLDLGILAERTGGSFWLSDATRPDLVALLSGGAVGFTAGVATSKFEQNLNNGGSSQSVKIETVSSGFQCAVKINGIQVGSAIIAKTVDVALASAGSTRFEPISVPTESAVRSFTHAREVDTRFFSDAILSTLHADASIYGLVQRLGYSDAEARKYFVATGSNGSAGFGIEFPGTTPKLTMVGRSEVILNADQIKQWPAPGEVKNISFVSLYRVSGGSIGGALFGGGGPGEVMAVKRLISIENKGATLVAQDLGTKAVSTVVPTTEMVDQCVFDRASNYSLVLSEKISSGIDHELPSRRTLYRGCDVLESSVQSRFENSDLALKSLNMLLTGLTQDWERTVGYRFQFGDWSSFVDANIISALGITSSKKLSVILEPTLLNNIDANVTVTRLSPGFAQMPAVFAPAIASLIQSFAVKSHDFSAEDRWLRRSIGAAAKLGDAYVMPFEIMTRSLMAPRGEDALLWIETAPAPLLQAGREAYDEARVLGYSTYISDTHSRFFEVRPTEIFLLAQRDRMRDVRKQMAKFPGLDPYRAKLSNLVLGSTRLNPQDVAATYEATAKLAGAIGILADEFLALMQTDPNAAEAQAARQWGQTLSASDGQLIRDYLTQSQAAGMGAEAEVTVRKMIVARPASAELKVRVDALALAKQFLVDEAARAKTSPVDVFYESEAKALAQRFVREGFSSADVTSLEVLAQVASREAICGNRKTVSYRLQCVGTDRISKAPGRILSPEYQGRYVTLATKIASWMGRLKSDGSDYGLLRTLRSALFASGDTPSWSKCSLAQIDANAQALEQAVQEYITVSSDLSAKYKAERAAAAVLDARCP